MFICSLSQGKRPGSDSKETESKWNQSKEHLESINQRLRREYIGLAFLYDPECMDVLFEKPEDIFIPWDESTGKSKGCAHVPRCDNGSLNTSCDDVDTSLPNYDRRKRQPMR